MRRFLLFLAVPLLASCSSVPVVWNPDGKSMTDLRSLRLQERRPSVELTKGVVLHADNISFTGKRHGKGEALGRVYLNVGAEARYAWMVERGYAGKAIFDRKGHWVILADGPMLERAKMTQVATDPATEFEIRWGTLVSEVIVRGATRTDFAKSHPIPPGTRVDGSPVPSRRVSPEPRAPVRSKY